MARSPGSSRSALPDPHPPVLRLGWAIEPCLDPELSVFRVMLVGFGLLRVDVACHIHPQHGKAQSVVMAKVTCLPGRACAWPGLV